MSLKRQYLSSSIWVLVGRGSSNFIGFIVFVVIARYLAPAEFGIVAFAAVFTDLARALALSGISQALVRAPQWEEGVASTAFWLNLGGAALLALLMAGGLGPILQHVYGGDFAAVVAALSLAFLIESSSSVHEAKLQREFRYRSLANRLLVGSLVGGGVGIGLAISGFGVWALVANRLVNAAAQAVIMWWTVPWRPRFHARKSEARPLISYVTHLGGSAIIGKLNYKIPELFLGIAAGVTSVGLYRVGSRAIFVIQDAIVAPLQSTTLSALSQARDRGIFASAYVRVLRSCGLVAFPVFLGAAVIAPDFTRMVFGPQWAASGQVMSALAVGGAASALQSFTQPALVVQGWTRLVAFNNLITFAIVVTLTFGLARWGAAAVAWGFCARGYLSIPLTFMLLTRRAGVDAGALARALFPSFLAALVMAGILWWSSLTVLADHRPWIRMGEMIALGGILYMMLLALLARRLVADVATEFRPMLNRMRRSSGQA